MQSRDDHEGTAEKLDVRAGLNGKEQSRAYNPELASFVSVATRETGPDASVKRVKVPGQCLLCGDRIAVPQCLDEFAAASVGLQSAGGAGVLMELPRDLQERSHQRFGDSIVGDLCELAVKPDVELQPIGIFEVVGFRFL